MAASGNGRRTTNGARTGNRTKQTTGRGGNRAGTSSRSGTRASSARSGARASTGNRTARRTTRSRTYRRSRPFFTRLWFWVLACFIIIFVVLITKGCDTGQVEQEAAPTVNDTHATVNATADGTKVPTTAPTSGGGNSTSAPTGQSTVPTQGTSAPTGTTAPRTQGTSAGNTSSVSTQQGTGAPTGPVYYENHHVAAGTQLIGSDLPAGTVDITVLSGAGSLATSDGTLSYPVFGEGYTTSLAGVRLASGTSITVSGNLAMKFSYITEPVIDRTPAALTGTVYTVSADNGNTVFSVGEMGDIEPGLYQITVISGYGEVVTSDAASGAGVNEMMGLTDSGGNYLQTVKNVRLNEGVSLTVRGCTVKLTRMEENND